MQANFPRRVLPYTYFFQNLYAASCSCILFLSRNTYIYIYFWRVEIICEKSSSSYYISLL
ncbi:hypothetical protein C1645_748040 [Glomus cerebriforme]|uniref:Uncharacterized protein n=1 Tax=Glomus cerebriforme TaxID=658196 RepID=A0A397TNV3_9GLOM|nr:hypothetical protein C1645_748040 [Glomus cerebriforme]